MANPYALFMNLLPKQTKYIAKIVVVSPDGYATVQSVGSASQSLVHGGTDSYAVDDYVMIVDGLITSKLPPTQDILEGMVI